MGSVRSSILFAGAAAAGFYLEMSLLGGLLRGSLALHSAIFQCLVAYTVFLAAMLRRWRLSFLPAILILAALLPFCGPSPWSLVAPAAVGLGWIRSGNCVSGTLIRRLASEIACTAGGLIMVAALNPQGLLGWTLAVWMFFLVQSLYFVAIPGDDPEHDMQARLDRFERARARAERALARLAGSAAPSQEAGSFSPPFETGSPSPPFETGPPSPPFETGPPSPPFAKGGGGIYR